MKRARKRGGNGDNLEGRSALLDFLRREDFEALEPRRQRQLLESVINLVVGENPPSGDTLGLYREMIAEAKGFSTLGKKAVLFGGGNGLSTILGGDNSIPAWERNPYAGLKMLFGQLTVVVCVTDDGGSTGELVRRLPVIALGDIRRAVLSGITPQGLKNAYRGIQEEQIHALPSLLQKIVNYRFASHHGRKSVLSLANSHERELMPEALADYLEEAWVAFRANPILSELPLRHHCLGNLLLITEIYRAAEKNNAKARVPGHREVIAGIHRFARKIGAGWKTIYPVSTNPGALKFLYSNGVVVTGEHKSSISRRGVPVERVFVEYVDRPRVDPRILKAIEEADIIVIAPGSIYSSLVPILQVEQIATAIRANHEAIKVLGANFWVQSGETDITIRDLEKEFYVSDLIEAYNKNVFGGTLGLFQQVVSTNLENLPADVIQSYALERKVPIYLDKRRVEKLGFEPLAVDVHSLARLEQGKVFQHDPAKFAKTVKMLAYLRDYLNFRSDGPGCADRGRKNVAGKRTADPSASMPMASTATAPRATVYLSGYMESLETVLDAMTIPAGKLRRLLPEIIWSNRDICIEHLALIAGIRVEPREKWKRSTEWDRILAYYDPEESWLHLRGDLLNQPEERITEDLLIGLGESLLGNYAACKTVTPLEAGAVRLGKVFEIVVQPEERLRAFLTREQIERYLELAHFLPDRERSSVYRMVINGEEAFTPPGLLFGLLYAWYLNNSFGCVIEHEMSLLKIPPSNLLPKLTMEQDRCRGLIEFFRRDVFRH